MLDLNPVYNYYSTVYMPKTQTKYDSHKTSELKTVYNNMVKINTNSPLFQVKVNDQLQNYAIGLKSAAIDLRNVSSFLSDDDEQAFSKLTTNSTNPQVITGQIITEDYSSLPEQLDFTVDKLAKPQINKGEFVSSTALDVIPGAYSFSLKAPDGTRSFNVNVNPDDSNISLQHKLATLITDSDIGIDATTEQQGSKTRLVLESQDTGTDDINEQGMMFELQDHTGHSSGVVDAYGLNNVYQFPANASFTINNTPQVSSSNSIAINKMVEVELNGTTKEPVQLQFVPDTENIIKKVTEFTDSYNRIIDIADENSNSQRGAKKLLHEVKGLTNRHFSALESVGINVNDNGHMKIDDALISESVKSGEMKKLFSDLSQFREDIITKTSNISLDPMNYVDKTIVTYPNPGHEFSNPYMPSMYSGMLYNYYV